jgi:hypothetical protein
MYYWQYVPGGMKLMEPWIRVVFKKLKVTFLFIYSHQSVFLHQEQLFLQRRQLSDPADPEPGIDFMNLNVGRKHFGPIFILKFWTNLHTYKNVRHKFA